MKLSEAIRLGAMCIPQTTGYDGCAIGAALYAIGENEYHQETNRGPSRFVAVRHWPFLENEYSNPLNPNGGKNELIAIIGDLNGFKVLDWTRERIAKWVSTIEPQEPPTTDVLSGPSEHTELVNDLERV